MSLCGVAGCFNSSMPKEKYCLEHLEVGLKLGKEKRHELIMSIRHTKWFALHKKKLAKFSDLGLQSTFAEAKNYDKYLLRHNLSGRCVCGKPVKSVGHVLCLGCWIKEEQKRKAVKNKRDLDYCVVERFVGGSGAVSRASNRRRKHGAVNKVVELGETGEHDRESKLFETYFKPILGFKTMKQLAEFCLKNGLDPRDKLAIDFVAEQQRPMGVFL